MAEMILRSRCALRLQDEKCCWTSTLAAWVTVSVRVGAAAREAALAELRAALQVYDWSSCERPGAGMSNGVTAIWVGERGASRCVQTRGRVLQTQARGAREARGRDRSEMPSRRYVSPVRGLIEREMRLCGCVFPYR